MDQQQDFVTCTVLKISNIDIAPYIIPLTSWQYEWIGEIQIAIYKLLLQTDVNWFSTGLRKYVYM